MSFVVEQNEISNVMGIGFLNLQAEMLDSDRLPYLVEQAWFLGLAHLIRGRCPIIAVSGGIIQHS